MNEHNLPTISVHELKEIRDSEQKHLLIDCRELHEWESMHIPGATLIPKDTISDAITSVCEDKSMPIYIYCRSGVRSLYAAHCLKERGYQDVYSVDGGIMDWAMFGYEIED